MQSASLASRRLQGVHLFLAALFFHEAEGPEHAHRASIWHHVMIVSTNTGSQRFSTRRFGEDYLDERSLNAAWTCSVSISTVSRPCRDRPACSHSDIGPDRLSACQGLSPMTASRRTGSEGRFAAHGPGEWIGGRGCRRGRSSGRPGRAGTSGRRRRARPRPGPAPGQRCRGACAPASEPP